MIIILVAATAIITAQLTLYFTAHARTGDLLVAVEVSFRGTPQRMPLRVPLDKIVRIIDKGEIN